jgi:hypothetical protein
MAINPSGIDFVKFKMLSKDLKNKYIGFGFDLTDEMFDLIKGSIQSSKVVEDINGDINISKLEDARTTIRNGISALEKALEKELTNRKRKKASTDIEYRAGLVKNAQKISGVNRTTITVDILLARVAKVCINGAVSAGKDIEDLFKKQVDAYDLTIREQASVLQLLEEMGYPIRRDRGILPGEDIDPRSEDNFDWMASYQN